MEEPNSLLTFNTASCMAGRIDSSSSQSPAFQESSVVDNIEQITNEEGVNKDDNPSNGSSMNVEYRPSGKHAWGPQERKQG